MTAQDFLYLEIAESIRRLIASGELEPGERLPSVRQMAEKWGCTPGTVSRAYAQLAREDLVEGHRGSGTRVRASQLHESGPVHQWAALVNRAEQFLLSALGSGHTSTQAQTALSMAVSRWQDLQQASIPSPAKEDASSHECLRFIGSHDLLIETLGRMLSECPTPLQLEWQYTGSLGGLIALAQNRADLAGTHLWDESTDTYNLPFVQRLLPGRRVVLLTLAHRSLGLLFPEGNPQEIHSIEDLGRPGIRLINRQRGSGTRVWFDAQLKAANIQGNEIEGYDQEEITHLAVAQAIQDGRATAGVGIYAVSALYNLDFIPLTNERYDLVFPLQVWESPAAETLVNLINSPEFKETVATLGGYDTSETGLEHWIS